MSIFKLIWHKDNLRRRNKNGIEGRGCNKRITYDENGTATKMRVEFQTRDGGAAGQMYVKCAVVDLMNGNGDVYATHVGAGYKEESNPVGVSAPNTDFNVS